MRRILFPALAATVLSIAAASPCPAARLARPCALQPAAAGPLLPVTPAAVLDEAKNGLYFDLAQAAPIWLPDSRGVLTVLANHGRNVIARISLHDGRCTAIADGAMPRPSPDGRWLAYHAPSHGSEQVWIARIDGSGARQLTAVAGGLDLITLYRGLYAWSPDSRRLAIAIPTPIAFDLGGRSTPGTANVTVYGRGENDDPHQQTSALWLYDVGGGTRTHVFDASDVTGNLSWFPDGRHILYTAERSWPARRRAVEIWMTDLHGRRRPVYQPRVFAQALFPAMSPDGRTLAIGVDRFNRDSYAMTSLAVLHIGSQHRRLLTPSSMPTSLLRSWSADGRTVYFTSIHGAYGEVWAAGLDGRVRRLVAGERSNREVHASPNGRWIAWQTRDAEGRADIRLARADGSGQSVLFNFYPAASRYAQVDAKQISYASSDGLRINGLFIPPLHPAPRKRAPLVVHLHGAGILAFEGSVLLTARELHLWSTMGYAVLVPDWRFYGNYGYDPLLRSHARQDYYERDLGDILAGIDAVVARGGIDSRRIYLIGFSAGALRTNLLLSRTNRFRAAVSIEGRADEYGAYARSPGGSPATAWMFGGYPWDVPERYFRNSAMYHVTTMRTPTLFVSGNPAKGAQALLDNQFLYTAMVNRGYDAQLLQYNDEGHVFTKPADQRDVLMRVIRWIRTH